jgi:hypothetical protein
MADTIPTWGYHSDLPPRIFHLATGEKLPAGWHDSPANVPAEAPRHPFDHDGDGRPGGSLPRARRGKHRGRK